MKKYNEGYVLPLVLVVLVVLCTVSLSVMAPAVSNLKVQEASIQRMQDRYAILGQAKSYVNNELLNGAWCMSVCLEEHLKNGETDKSDAVFTQFLNDVERHVEFDFKGISPEGGKFFYSKVQPDSNEWVPEGETSFSISPTNYRSSYSNDGSAFKVSLDLDAQIEVHLQYWSRTDTEAGKTYYRCTYTTTPSLDLSGSKFTIIEKEVQPSDD